MEVADDHEAASRSPAGYHTDAFFQNAPVPRFAQIGRNRNHQPMRIIIKVRSDIRCCAWSRADTDDMRPARQLVEAISRIRSPRPRGNHVNDPSKS